MYSDDVQWLSQNIFTHRDKEYGTNGFLRVSISTNTKDSHTFSAPTFVINIQNDGINKTTSLSYQKLFEIYGRLQEVVQAAGAEYSSKDGSPDAQLHYKTGKSAFITFEFLRGSQQNEPVVRITISHGTSDSVKIILPFSPEFHSFISLIGDMVGNRKYLDWCLHLPNRFFMVEMNEVMKQIPGLIKSAVVQIDDNRAEEPSKSSTPTSFGSTDLELPTSTVDSNNVAEASETLKELDAFVGEDMKNIKLNIPIEMPVSKEKSTDRDIDDSKMFKWLGGDVRNFESVIMRCSEKKNPLRQIQNEINENYADFECFPNATQEDMKSMIYLVGREFVIYNAQANTSAVKRSFGINKYKGRDFATPANLDLAYDLLLISLFVRLCRERIENKTPDNYANKTFLHIATSLHLAPFIFSFIKSGTEVASILKERFRQLDIEGFFDSYKEKEYKMYGFEITERDIIDAGDAVTENFFSSKSYHNDSILRHVALFNANSCLLKPDSLLNEEQIINQVVPLELHMIQNNMSLDDKKLLMAYATENKIDSDVLSLFVKSTPTKNIPIVKFFENNINDIPEEFRIDFMKTIMEYNEKDYDLSDEEFPYNTFSDEAIKALFLWKPETGEKYTTYKKFYKAIVASTHDKNTILSMIAHEEEDVEGETFADFLKSPKGKEK
jgi:hypothetical protein